VGFGQHKEGGGDTGFPGPKNKKRPNLAISSFETGLILKENMAKSPNNIISLARIKKDQIWLIWPFERTNGNPVEVVILQADFTNNNGSTLLSDEYSFTSEMMIKFRGH